MGRRGFNLLTIPWHGGFENTRRIIDSYCAGLREAGHDSSKEVLGMYYTHVAGTPAQARAQAEGPWAAHERISAADRGTPERKLLRDYDTTVASTGAIFGDPAMCRRHIERIQAELHLDRIACVFHFGGMPQDQVLASMRLFAAEVAPAFL
jgi:alkanesulfonate monooxygenase SsuD/methylene tetrahydromethanopterin reductase-like flavin-dependent oxidoreductase (luciferase family)